MITGGRTVKREKRCREEGFFCGEGGLIIKAQGEL